jgi:hypothetical protein
MNANVKTKLRDKKKKNRPVINYQYVDTLNVNKNFVPMYMGNHSLVSHPSQMSYLPGLFQSSM